MTGPRPTAAAAAGAGFALAVIGAVRARDDDAIQLVTSHVTADQDLCIRVLVSLAELVSRRLEDDDLQAMYESIAKLTGKAEQQ